MWPWHYVPGLACIVVCWWYQGGHCTTCYVVLSAWAFWRLYRAIPAMQLLRQEGISTADEPTANFLRRLWEQSG